MKEFQKAHIKWTRIKISINTDTSILVFYIYIKNIDEHFDKNFRGTKIVQILWKCLKKLKKYKNKIKNTHIKSYFINIIEIGMIKDNSYKKF